MKTEKPPRKLMKQRVFEKTDKIGKTLPRLIEEETREDTNYQYQEWNRNYHYTPCRLQKNKKEILQTILHT